MSRIARMTRYRRAWWSFVMVLEQCLALFVDGRVQLATSAWKTAKPRSSAQLDRCARREPAEAVGEAGRVEGARDLGAPLGEVGPAVEVHRNDERVA